jgi:DNA-binding transcriptional ArsR family regulator
MLTMKPRVHVVKSPEQLRVLASAARQEIVDVLSRMGTVSVSELADTLGRPPDALYYHLRELVRSGLVERVSAGRRDGRQEAQYRTQATELHLTYPPGGKEKKNVRAVSAIVGSMLRMGIRDFRRALESGDAEVSGPGRELWALRATGWLSPQQVRDVNQQMKSLRSAVWKPKGKGRLYGITVLLTPLDHRGRKSQRTNSKGKAKRK